jgi:micrococcal nuclease
MRPRVAQARHVLLVALLGTAAPAAPGETFEARVVDVHDGDTITVLRDDHSQVRVRLEGVDCPELGQDFGRRAKEFTAGVALGRDAKVLGKEWDRHGRLVARVLVDGKDVSHELVRAGFAWHFKKYSSDQYLAAEELVAREAKVGLWRQPNPIAPWDYRHGIVPGVDLSDTTLHGNENSLVYHRPGCPQYRCRRCTRRFATEEEARAAGFKPAGCCAKDAR